MFDGSDIATISVAPARLTGMSWCRFANSGGTSWMTSVEISSVWRRCRQLVEDLDKGKLQTF